MAKDTLVLAVSGTEIIDEIDGLPTEIRRAAKIAVNEATVKGRTRMARKVLEDVALPRSYVQPAGRRLYVSRMATESSLEATIFARSRRTSLTRFIPGGPQAATGRRNIKGLSVKVDASGGAKFITGAFIFKLRGAGGETDPDPNLGFAVRTKNGKAPRNAYQPTKISENLWLLYGPSVAQILHSDRNGGGVVSDTEPEIKNLLTTEFYRQMDL